MKLKFVPAATENRTDVNFIVRDGATNREVGWIQGPQKNGTQHWTYKLAGFHIGAAPTSGSAFQDCLAFYRG